MGGGDKLGPYATSRRAADRHVEDGPHVQPGKTGISTGLPTVDNQLCEAHPKTKGCFLDEGMRTRVLGLLSDAVQIALGNAEQALLNLRVELLTSIKSTSAWNGFVELIFLASSSGLIKKLVGSLTAFKAGVQDQLIGAAYRGEVASITFAGLELSPKMVSRIERLKPEHLSAALTTASKGLRTTLKNAAHGMDDSNRRDADFLKLIQAEIGPMKQELTKNAPSRLTDVELVAMTHAYGDMNFHSLAAYEEEFRSLLDRYRAEHIDEIGQSRSMYGNAYKELVHVVRADGVARVAIVELYDKNPSQPVKGYNGKVVPFEQTQFVSWVDDDLVSVATQFQHDRRGDVKVLDASKETGMPEIDAWARTT